MKDISTGRIKIFLILIIAVILMHIVIIKLFFMGEAPPENIPVPPEIEEPQIIP